MATAAEKRITIEKGADYIMNLTVKNADTTARDLTNFTITLKLYAKNAPNVAVVTQAGTIENALLGITRVVVDKAITSTLATDPTGVDPLIIQNPFATSYNYYYTIDINNAITGEDIRILRGKASVRI